MMKKLLKNRKGFAMAELLAVCIIVLGIFSMLFANYLPLLAEYENRINYNNVTAQYASHYIRKMYLSVLNSANTKEQYINIIEQGISNGNGVFTVYGKGNTEILNQLSSNRETLEKLIENYGIEEIAITKYNLQEAKEKYKNGNLKNYINYLPTYKNSSNIDTEYYRLIIKTKNYGYATTPILFDNNEENNDNPSIENNYNVGDVIILKDNSKWFYLSSDNLNTYLLSVNMVDEDGSFINDAWNAYKMQFDSSGNTDYNNSDIKNFIDTKVAPSLRKSLKNSNVNDNIIEDIEIGLIKASIVSDIGNIDNWSSTSDGAFAIESPNKYFLGNRSLTYWTETAKNDKYVWIVNASNNLWYGTTNSASNFFGIRPMITIKTENLQDIKKEVENPELEIIDSPNYLVYDVKNSKVILEANDNSNEVWHPASLTKITTAIVAIQEMEKQNINLEDKVTITEEIMNTVPATSSMAGFKAGDIVTYEDLLNGVIHKSGGDACHALAILLTGSTTNFVKLMNDFAAKNNMTNTHYTNSTGLINANYQHYSSLKDIATVFTKGMENEIFRNIVMPKVYTTYNGLTFYIPEFGDLPYIVGLKNGRAVYYDLIKSGYNQANYYRQGNNEYVVVTSSNPNDETKENRTIDNYLLWKYLFD